MYPSSRNAWVFQWSRWVSAISRVTNCSETRTVIETFSDLVLSATCLPSVATRTGLRRLFRTSIVTSDLSDMTIGESHRARSGLICVMMKLLLPCGKTGPPALRVYPVDPAGVETITPSPMMSLVPHFPSGSFVSMSY